MIRHREPSRPVVAGGAANRLAWGLSTPDDRRAQDGGPDAGLKSCSRSTAILPAAISCRFPDPPTCPTACSARSTMPTIDHRGPEFARARQDGARRHEARVSRPTAHVVIYPSSGTGAWEAGARQHAVAGRSRADGRNRSFCDVVEAARRTGSGSTSGSCRAIGATALRPSAIEGELRNDPRTRSRPCASCTTRRRPA
mgnify:CR=1 FL=1